MDEKYVDIRDQFVDLSEFDDAELEEFMGKLIYTGWKSSKDTVTSPASTRQALLHVLVERNHRSATKQAEASQQLARETNELSKKTLALTKETISLWKVAIALATISVAIAIFSLLV